MWEMMMKRWASGCNGFMFLTWFSRCRNVYPSSYQPLTQDKGRRQISTGCTSTLPSFTKKEASGGEAENDLNSARKVLEKATRVNFKMD